MNSGNNWSNNQNFNNFGGWNSNVDQEYPDQDYYEEMDDSGFDNRYISILLVSPDFYWIFLIQLIQCNHLVLN